MRLGFIFIINYCIYLYFLFVCKTNKKHELYKSYKDVTGSILLLLSFSPNLSVKGTKLIYWTYILFFSLSYLLVSGYFFLIIVNSERIICIVHQINIMNIYFIKLKTKTPTNGAFKKTPSDCVSKLLYTECFKMVYISLKANEVILYYIILYYIIIIAY